jgi:tetratricopeptide (TPR) repeat protein
MNAKHLQQILSDYSQMSVDSLIELKNLIEDYPYCQTAQILYLLNLRRLEEDTFDARLPYAAICVNNRQKLKCAVEKVDEILARESGKTVKKKERPISEQLLRVAQDDNRSEQTISVRTFRNKTISELLNSQEEPKPAEVSSVTRIKLPQTQVSEDFLLEQLRQEALAKVNERLLEIRKTEMVDVNFSETPKRMAAAKDLINKVIETNPKISKIDDSDKPLAHWKIKEEHSLRDDFEIVSETLALLYVSQGLPEKAHEIYKTLSQKYPEKAEYFTQLGKQIKPIKSKTTTKVTKTKSNNHKPKTKQ